MTFTVERLPNDPIIIITFSGAVNADMVAQATLHVEALLSEYRVNTVLVFDTTKAETDFKHILEILQETTGADPDEEAVDFTILTAFVGTSAMIKLYINAARQKQFGGQTFPLFATLEDAITAMRISLASLTTEKKVLD